MPAYRPLIGVLLLASAFHLVGMALNPLPAQDGLKFIRFAKGFQTQPFVDVIRGADQHPLYPALIALAEPIVQLGTGPGHHAWRIAAQGVSTLASLALLVPLYLLTLELFDRRTATLSALLFVLLPVPGGVGHDTLSNPLALLGFTSALWLGMRTLRLGNVFEAIGCGLASGFGFLARPEVALLPLVLVLVVSMRWAFDLANRRIRFRTQVVPLASLSLSFLVVVGSYAILKGDVSEKLALRHATGIGEGPQLVRTSPIWLPSGLDDPRWDFSAKEEWDHPTGLAFPEALIKLFQGWGEGLAWVLLPLAAWGAWNARGSGIAGKLMLAYALIFSAVLVRHAMALGYLSSRHPLSLVLIAIPWAAWAILRVSQRLSARTCWSANTRQRLAFLAILTVILGSAAVQWRPGHPSRWGHLQAGRWLAAQAKANPLETPGAVLDTRGWAAFVSGWRSYDYWHVRQALTDPSLSYIVVTDSELNAPTPRAETLRALLAHSSTPAAGFPERRGGQDVGVRVYRYRQPESWEGLIP